MPNFIEIEETLCGRMEGHLRLTLLGQLIRVELIKYIRNAMFCWLAGKKYCSYNPIKSIWRTFSNLEETQIKNDSLAKTNSNSTPFSKYRHYSVQQPIAICHWMV